MIYILLFKYKVELELVTKPCLNTKVVHTKCISHYQQSLRGVHLSPVQYLQSHQLWTPSPWPRRGAPAGFSLPCLIFQLSSCPSHCSAPKFLVLFYDFSLLYLSFCSCIMSMISLNFLSVCSHTSLSFLKTILQNSLSSSSQISISLGSFTVKLLCCLVGSDFLDFSCPLKPSIGVCRPIQRKSHFFWFLLSGSTREIPYLHLSFWLGILESSFSMEAPSLLVLLEG